MSVTTYVESGRILRRSYHDENREIDRHEASLFQRSRLSKRDFNRCFLAADYDTDLVEDNMSSGDYESTIIGILTMRINRLESEIKCLKSLYQHSS